MDKCEGLWNPREENDIWSRVQPILDKYGEEIFEKSSADWQKPIGLNGLLESGAEFARRIFNRFPHSNFIGYKPEFWDGLEDWKPPTNENEVRSRLVDEVKKFAKEIISYRNDYERALLDRPSVDVNAEELLNEMIGSFPAEMQMKIEKLKSELPDDWLSDPETVLRQLENSSVSELIRRNRYESEVSTNIDKPSVERTISGSENLQLSDDEETECFEKAEQFFYDDEEKSKDDADDKAPGESTGEAQPFDTDKSNASVVQNDDRTTFRIASSKDCVATPAPYVIKVCVNI